MKTTKKSFIILSVFAFFLTTNVFAFDLPLLDKKAREEKRQTAKDELQKKFQWWPTDAQPAPVQDGKGGYWWWPKIPGKAAPWGNRGFVFVYKIIFDYKEEELPAPKPQEMRASLIVKKIAKNVKIYFDYDKADLREDHIIILDNAVKTLKRNPSYNILITGSCDRRGSESYNLKLGNKRGEAVKQFMLDNGIPAENIKIISRGKLDAVAPMSDILGMEKDRNAHFVIAEVEEVMMPYNGPVVEEGAKQIEEGKYLIEKEENVESSLKAETTTYIIKKGDTLWKIANKELKNGNRWKYLYEMNKDKIKNPNKLKAGTKIILPIE